MKILKKYLISIVNLVKKKNWSKHMLNNDKNKIKICFVSLNSYPLLKKFDLGYAGGAEIQQVAISKKLAEKGYNIIFITYGTGNSIETESCGIKILQTYSRSHAKDINLFKKIYYLYLKMQAADADIYYYHAGSPGIVTIIAKLLRKKIVYHIASDALIIEKNIIKKNLIENILGKIGNWIDIKLSNAIISQNNFQKLLLKKKFGKESILIKNVVDLPPIDNNKTNKENILWIGTIRSVKQPEIFLKITEQFPNNRFIMIGGMGESIELFEKIKNKSKTIKNLEFKGFIPHDKIYTHYTEAILMINTSEIEGFPNIFLEAWMYSIPILSLNVDPDGIIAKYKMGYCSYSIDQLIIDLRYLLDNRKLIKTMGQNGRRYIEENHDIKKIILQYEQLFSNMIKN